MQGDSGTRENVTAAAFVRLAPYPLLVTDQSGTVISSNGAAKAVFAAADIGAGASVSALARGRGVASLKRFLQSERGQWIGNLSFASGMTQRAEVWLTRTDDLFLWHFCRSSVSDALADRLASSGGLAVESPRAVTADAILDLTEKILTVADAPFHIFRVNGDELSLARTSLSEAVLERLRWEGSDLTKIRFKCPPSSRVARALASGKPLLLGEGVNLWREILPPEQQHVVGTIAPGVIKSGVLAPVVVDEAPWALLVLEGPRLEKSDMPTAEFLATQMAVQISHLQDREALDQEMLRRHTIEEELVRSERLAAVGELAAHMAHEIRNPLGAIHNSVDWLYRRLDTEGTAKRQLEIVSRASNRLNGILTDFLAYSRPHSPVRASVDLRALVNDAIAMVSAHPDAASVVFSVTEATTLRAARLDRTQISQVLENLLLNAAQARQQAECHVEVGIRSESGEATITITDDGSGMSHEELTRAFEPFFSTRKAGTGLGLAIAHRMVQEHGGTISARSVLGSGTTFTLKLPEIEP